MSAYLDWLMSRDYMQRAVRDGGAIVIARCIAARSDPEATADELASADLWEATMRERHGDPKPGWLAKEVERQKASRVKHKAFMKPFELEFGTERIGGRTSLAVRAAIASCMAEAGFPVERKL